MLLHELQEAFAAATFGKDTEALLPHIACADAERRFAVYRNNVRHNLREALRAVYPVVERIVGERFFEYAADRYIERYPSTSGDIHGFGDGFPTFLAEFAPAAQLPYLPDTARLEWAMHQAFHGPDHAPLDLDRLARLPPSSHASLQFALHPACVLLSSPYPVHSIWQWNQSGAQAEATLDIGGGGAGVLVRRSGYDVECVPLSIAQYAMLRALSNGQALNAACEAALDEDPDFDIAGFLQDLVIQGIVVDVHAGPTAEAR